MRRQKWECWAEILNLARKPVRKTAILYHANLSYEFGTKYIQELITLGMLVTNSPTYQITEKGRIFLDLLTQVIRLTQK